MISASETHPSCAKCKLYQGCNSPFMEAAGARNPRIMVVGEAPGCITGDTFIEVAFRDKSIYPYGIPIADLVGLDNLFVYTCDVNSRDLLISHVNKVWKTGRKKVYRVTYEWKYVYGKDVIDIQNSIDVTSNHKFLLKRRIKHDPFLGSHIRDVDYLSIDDGLTVGDSLQPFLRRTTAYSRIGTHNGGMIKESRFLLEYKIGRKFHNLCMFLSPEHLPPQAYVPLVCSEISSEI